MSAIENYAVFRARQGGKTHAVLMAIKEEREKAQQARNDFAEEFGCRFMLASENSVDSLVFPNKVPDGWRAGRAEIEGKGTPAKPDKTKLGKEIAQRMRDLPSLPGWPELTRRIGSGPAFCVDRIRWCFVRKLGDEQFIWSPFFPKENDESDNPEMTHFTPEDCDRVKYSEYYAAVEAVEGKR